MSNKFFNPLRIAYLKSSQIATRIKRTCLRLVGQALFWVHNAESFVR